MAVMGLQKLLVKINVNTTKEYFTSFSYKMLAGMLNMSFITTFFSSLQSSRKKTYLFNAE